MAKPLTKKDRNGMLYARPMAIEAAIDVANQQNIDCLRRRAWLSDIDDSDFLPMECLVHLIRDALRRGDEPTVNALMPAFLARSERMLTAKIPDGGRVNAAEIRENILSDFSLLFIQDGRDDHSNVLDFFECRFARAFKFFRIDYLRREGARSARLQQLPAEDDGRASLDENPLTEPREGWQVAATQEQVIFQGELLEAINNLPCDERRAVVLCGVLGLKEESEDPTVTTAATLCGVTGRTIRNRLARAAKRLSQYKEIK